MTVPREREKETDPVSADNGSQRQKMCTYTHNRELRGGFNSFEPLPSLTSHPLKKNSDPNFQQDVENTKLSTKAKTMSLVCRARSVYKLCRYNGGRYHRSPPPPHFPDQMAVKKKVQALNCSQNNISGYSIGWSFIITKTSIGGGGIVGEHVNRENRFSPTPPYINFRKVVEYNKLLHRLTLNFD